MDTKYFLNDNVYAILKWIGLLLLPAAATFIGVVGQAWGWPDYANWVVTLNAAGVFVGAIIGYSAGTAKQVDSDEKPEESNTNAE